VSGVLIPGQRTSRNVSLALNGLAWLVTAAFVLPIVWMVVNSLRPTQEIVTASARLQDMLIPTTVNLDDYTRLFATPFAAALVNSIVVAAVVTVVGLAICVLAAFALSVLRFRHQTALFSIVVISFVIPTDATAFALLRLARQVGFQDTYIGLIVPVMVDGIVILLLRQFFLGIPREFLDSARVDGASSFVALTRIYLPLSRPALIGGALLLFIGQWTSYLWPLLIVNDPHLMLAPIALAQAASGEGQHYVDYGAMFAGAVILTAIPVLILLPLQRYFVQSVTGSGVKG
jgi:putative chitobiose transport system permease protein